MTEGKEGWETSKNQSFCLPPTLGSIVICFQVPRGLQVFC